jgi:predicted phosphoribosyltransferase
MFRDREEAAEKLADALQRRRGSNPLVIAIPRGAVPMGAIVARRLGGALDVVLVRKLGARYDPELAIGAVDETGWTYVAPHARSVGATSAYIESQVARELATIRERRRRYTPDRGPLDPAGRVVIVVDDGLATGATMVAALHALRARGPREIVCAIPVASHEALSLVRAYADEVVCLETPDWFGAVGQAYRSFPQVSDEEVVEALGAASSPVREQSR